MNLAIARRTREAGVVAVLIGLLAGAATGQQAKASKRADIYDPKADANAQLAAATAKARRDHSRVLVMFGGNWCGWCHKLHDLFAKDQSVRKLLHDEYIPVMADLEAPRAAELLKRCKGALSEDELRKGVGYPFLAVLDGDGSVVTAQRTDPLEEGDHHDPEKVRSFLAKWVAERQDAGKVLAAALARASSEDKRVFLHFGAPWCGWCHRLDDFLARDDVAAILGRDFVEVKIDLDRMAGGKDVLKRYNPDAASGIPWSAFLDSKGEVLATSDGPKGNIGYPAEPQEIAHFLAMLKKSTRRTEPGQIDRIEQILKDEAARIKQGR
jgi:thiol-disulfide isomerase/thioredoxin